MPVICTGCQTSLPISAPRPGQQVRCPWCGNSFTVPSAGVTAPPPPVPAPPVAVAAAPRDRPARRAAVAEADPPGGSNRGAVVGLVAVGGVLGLGMLLLLGLCLFLASRSGSTVPAGPEVAATTPGPDAEPKPPREREEGPANTLPGQGPEELPAVGDPGPDDPARPRTGPRLGPPIEAVPRFASFMGAKAWGRRFCIIADTSGSMQMNNRMNRLKEELKKTLNELGPDQEFHVMFFHSSTDPMPEKGWLRGGGKDINRILPWIEGQRPRGGTQPMDAFERAFALEPRPDAIFFMTDGLIPPNVPQRVADLNGKGRDRVPINTILFGGEIVDLPQFRFGKMDEKRREQMLARFRERFQKMQKQAEELLERIARDSGGSHRFVADDGAKKKP